MAGRRQGHDGTQSEGAVDPIAARLAAWAAVHRSLPPSTFFAVYFPALKDEGLAIMTSRDFLSLDEAMHALLSRAGVRGLAALAQQQQNGVVGQLAAAVIRGDRLNYAEGFVVPVCCTCGKADTGHLLRCGKCHTASYCSEKCQRQSWGRHKKVCPLMAAEMEGVNRSAQRAQQQGESQQQAAQQAAAPAGPAAGGAAAAERAQQGGAAAPKGGSASASAESSTKAAPSASSAVPGAAAAAAWGWPSDPATRRLLLGGGAVLVAAAAAGLAMAWWRRH